MRAEKKFITQEYVRRLNASPFFIAIDYRGLSVTQFTVLRQRLAQAGAEVHVVKNSIFRAAAREAGIGDLAGALVGQLAVVTGQRDISAAAKVLKTLQGEFDRPQLRFGYLDNQRLATADLVALADLPPLESLRAQLLGTLQAPAQDLVRLLHAPATQLAQVLRAWKEEREAAAA